MISAFIHLFNIYSHSVLQHINSNDSLESYREFVLNMNTFNLECNFCHWKGCCIRHGYYTRNYIASLDTPDDNNTSIQILRVKCKHCGKTHAIMPEEIIPYLQYTSFFIFKVLWMYYIKKKSTRDICDEFNIAVPQLHRWKRRFEKHKEQFLGLLESARVTALDALGQLAGLPDYGRGFARKFLAMTERIPMQQHANPTNTRLPVFS